MHAIPRNEQSADDESGPDAATPQLAPVTAPLRIDQLGWTRAEAADIHARLQSFAEDWDDPDMDVYDAI